MIQEYISEITTDEIIYSHARFSIEDERRFGPHYHEKCEMIYIIAGDVHYIVEGKAYKLKKGDVVLSRPRQIHSILPADGTVYERYIMLIDPKNIPHGVWDALKIGADVYHCEEGEIIEGILERLDLYFGKFAPEDYEILAKNAATEIFSNLSLKEADVTTEKRNPTLSRALDYIRENLTEIKDIDEICSALYITKSYLHHLFNQHLKIPPAKYITTKRLIFARRRILKGARPTEIYQSAGFCDYATFYRNYKRHFGYSPTQEGKTESAEEIRA